MSKLAYAHVNWGRWIWTCPVCIYGAEEVSAEHMTCSTCGAEVVVVMPDETRRIEAALKKRPELANRNWVVGESVADLLAENRERLP